MKSKYHIGSKYCNKTKDPIQKKTTYHCSKCSHASQCINGRALLGANRSLGKIMRGKQ